VSDYLARIWMKNVLPGLPVELRTFEVVIPAQSESDAVHRATSFAVAIMSASSGTWRFATSIVAECIAVEPYTQED
jgi:hypothetical protein